MSLYYGKRLYARRHRQSGFVRSLYDRKRLFARRHRQPDFVRKSLPREATFRPSAPTVRFYTETVATGSDFSSVVTGGPMLYVSLYRGKRLIVRRHRQPDAARKYLENACGYNMYPKRKKVSTDSELEMLIS